MNSKVSYRTLTDFRKSSRGTVWKIWKITTIICQAVSNGIKFSKFDFLKSDYVWCGKKQQMIMLFVAKFYVFFASRKSYPSLTLI